MCLLSIVDPSSIDSNTPISIIIICKQAKQLSSKNIWSNLENCCYPMVWPHTVWAIILDKYWMASDKFIFVDFHSKKPFYLLIQEYFCMKFSISGPQSIDIWTRPKEAWFKARWEFLSWSSEIHFLSLLWFRWNYILIWRKFHKNKRNNKTQLSYGFKIFSEM